MNGQERFEYYLRDLELLLQQAGKQRNPGLFLYRKKARNILFMLEGLAKLYAQLHNSKRFSKMKAQFKLLEDILGAIDYYDTLATELSENSRIDASLIRYFQGQMREKVQQLNDILEEKGWMGPVPRRLLKIRSKLADANWMPAAKEVLAFKEAYDAFIYEIVEVIHSPQLRFEHMETDVHELRRKLRWLSIYPHALRGAIQLQDVSGNTSGLKIYQTPAVLSSPFIRFPEALAGSPVLFLQQPSFYALSWMTEALGTLKDAGLRVEALREALLTVHDLEGELADKRIYRMLGKKQELLPDLLQEASKITRVFFGKNVLEQLIAGVGTAP